MEKTTVSKLEKIKAYAWDSVVGGSEKSLKDYNTYKMTPKEFALWAAVALGVSGGLVYLFYRSFWGWVLISPLCLLYPAQRRKGLIAKQKQELLLQFKEALYVISASLTAGKSVEMAFKTALTDLKNLYIDSETPILKELEIILRKMELNGTLEEALSNFSKRAHLEDVRNFSEVFSTCKRRGGNVIEIIRSTSETIADKIRTRQEIETHIAEKKLEQKVMMSMPVLMVVLLKTSSPEFMEPVYTTVMGRIGMSIAVGIFIVSFWVSQRIMDIEV